MNSGLLKRSRVRLRCSLGRWQNWPAYSVDLWDNPAWGNGRNLSGAFVQVLGHPPRGFRPTEKNEVFTAGTSKGRGHPVHPVFYHTASGSGAERCRQRPQFGSYNAPGLPCWRVRAGHLGGAGHGGRPAHATKRMTASWARPGSAQWPWRLAKRR